MCSLMYIIRTVLIRQEKSPAVSWQPDRGVFELTGNFRQKKSIYIIIGDLKEQFKPTLDFARPYINKIGFDFFQ